MSESRHNSPVPTVPRQRLARSGPRAESRQHDSPTDKTTGASSFAAQDRLLRRYTGFC